MSLFKALEIGSSGVGAQSVRLNAVASNLANADSVADASGEVYKARHVVFEASLAAAGGAGNAVDSGLASRGVKVAAVVEDATPGRKVFDPKHPRADGEGYVTYANVNPVEEMVNMIAASRAYETNVEVMNTAKNLLLKTLQLGS